MYYPLYYSDSPNFGDAINPVLYKRITGRERTYADLDASPKILSCGSVAHNALPYDIVWGTGCISRDTPMKCSVTTQVLAARGPLTAELFYKKTGVFCEIYGDPGLLISRYFEPSDRTKEYGIIPNYVDRDLVSNDPHYIDIMSGIENVIKSVTSCNFIISSALHGIICAEAFGIPAVWVELSDNVAGQGFKFADYYIGTGRLPQVGLNWRKKHSMKDVYAVVKGWEPPRFNAELLLSVCPFDWRKTDYKRWEKVGDWAERNDAIARIINEGATVIEFGAGGMGLRNKLNKCSYTPSDIIRRSDDTVICDLNTGIFPDLSKYDTIIFSGVMEYVYLEYIEKFLEHTREYNIKTFVCSYNHADSGGVNGWVNSLSKGELINLFCSKGGFTLKHDYGGIYEFTRRATTP